MNNSWIESVRRERLNYPVKMPKLIRVKIGRILLVYASLPLLSFWAYGLALPLMCPIRPSLWAADRLRELKIKWSLR